MGREGTQKTRGWGLGHGRLHIWKLEEVKAVVRRTMYDVKQALNPWASILHLY